MSTAAADGSLSGGGGGGGELADVVVELVTASIRRSSSDSISEEQMLPLLTPSEKPKIDIFAVSYPRRKPNKEQLARLTGTETSPFTQFFMWAWSGSTYSGLSCMALSSAIYCMMEVLSDTFSAQSIPLFEVASIRCTITLILSFLWLRRSREPLFGPTNARNLFISRALIGYLSLLSFVYCIQRLPLPQAIVLSFTTPVVASIAARMILHEKLKLTEIGGLTCSFFGVLLIFRPILTAQGWLANSAEVKDSHVEGSNYTYAVLIGLFSSITGGFSFCLIRASAKASDQPVVTVFLFGLFASPASVICTLTFEDLVLPGLFSLCMMVALGVLAFFAEVFLARGLQMEKTSKVVNIQYIEVVLSQIWGMSSLRIAPSWSKLAGCLLILMSTSYTWYLGPEINDADE